MNAIPSFAGSIVDRTCLLFRPFRGSPEVSIRPFEDFIYRQRRWRFDVPYPEFLGKQLCERGTTRKASTTLK